MTAVLTLVRRQLGESRWFLGLTALALFGLSWLFAFLTARSEARARRDPSPAVAMRRMAMARMFGGPSADTSSTSFEVAAWRQAFVILILMLWPISRGSIAVAGELERGTMDLVMSRPISRPGYLSSQAITALLGIVATVAALIVGNVVGNHFNVVESPPGWRVLLRPGLNAAALALVVYGYTLMLSTFDSVRWRVTLASSVLTLGGFIAQAVANMPEMESSALSGTSCT